MVRFFNAGFGPMCLIELRLSANGTPVTCWDEALGDISAMSFVKSSSSDGLLRTFAQPKPFAAPSGIDIATFKPKVIPPPGTDPEAWYSDFLAHVRARRIVLTATYQLADKGLLSYLPKRTREINILDPVPALPTRP